MKLDIRSLIFSTLLVWTAVPAHAGTAIQKHYKCDYAFMGAPFVTLEFDQLDDYHVSKMVSVTHYGSTHQETFQLVNQAKNEKLHAWISKESKDNQIEYILFREATNNGNSEIINNQMPMLKEIWGNCL